MNDLLADFTAAHPGDVIRRGGEIFLAAEAVTGLIDEAERHGVKVLGLEGFLVSDGQVYPALSRIANFSADPAQLSAARSRDLLSGPWASPPTPADQMHPEAAGRYMIAVVLDS
jgi:hypothetical protein